MQNRFFSILLSLTAILSARSQETLTTAQDEVIFNSLATKVGTKTDASIGNTMVQIGQSFLGTPYVANTLDDTGKEALVINLRELDCTTFVENVLVLSQLAQADKLTWGNYPDMLQQVRYRNGVRNGYPSRLHYLTDWIRNNSQKGLLKDITKDLRGAEQVKPINFMGTHRNSYPALAEESNWVAVREVEQELSQLPLWILPQGQISEQEYLLQDGDIIALATDIDGLDVTHTGLAMRLADDRIHLLHASTVGEVVISEKPLADYLKGIKRNIGIIVARPVATK
jgi:hypothetical protein